VRAFGVHRAPGAGLSSEPTVATILVLAGGGLVALVLASVSTLALVAAPLGLALGFAFARRPVPLVAAIVVLTSAYGTLEAFTPAPAARLIDGAIATLWIAVVFGYLRLGANRSLRPVPGLLLLMAYVAIGAVGVITATNFSAALESFHLTGWHMLAVAAVGLAPWSAVTFERMAKAIVLVGLVVGAYCTYRHFTGSAPAELRIANAAHPEIPFRAFRFFGSFPSAQELASWSATILPFCVALGLAWRGRWRLAAGLACPVLLIPLLAADVRTGTVAAAAGSAIALVLYLGARAFPTGIRLGTGLIAVIALIAIGGSAFALTVAGSPTEEERLAGILDPSNDVNFQVRSQRWEQAWHEIERQPFGYGLGSAGAGLSHNTSFATFGNGVPAGTRFIDNSYLKVGIEQGLFVMILFAGLIVVLLVSLAWGAITIDNRGGAALCIAATATLVSLAILFFGSTYVESTSIVPAWIAVGLGVAELAAVPVVYRRSVRTAPLLPRREPSLDQALPPPAPRASISSRSD
jgi:hypothetical protein